MTTIMFFIVYAGFIVCTSFLMAPAMYKLSGTRIAQRNPEWLSSQPALADRLRRRTLPVRLSWLAGACQRSRSGRRAASRRRPGNASFASV